jgi:hypothetical protein
MTAEDRLEHLNRVLSAMQSSWAPIAEEIGNRIGDYTASLIAENNEETRGRIKALRDLLNLPDALLSERDGIKSGLSEQSDPEI